MYLNLLIQNINIRLEINKYINSDFNTIPYQEIKNNVLIFFFKLVNDKILNKKRKYSLITFFPIGYLHNKLFNLFISIASLKVDIQLINNQRIVKMEIEGFPSKEDIVLIAKSLIPDIDDLSLNENGWEEGYIGIIQLILIANLSTLLRKKSYS